MPTFWTEQPEVCFLQAEAQFHNLNFTGDTMKYYHAVAALDRETSGRILDNSLPHSRQQLFLNRKGG